MAASIRANFKLGIDRLALEARLTLIPDPQGPLWSREKLLESLRRKNIRGGVDLKALDAAFSQAAASPKPTIWIAARGTAPVPSQPSRLIPENLPIPPELKEEARAVFSAQPRVYERLVEKVRVEKRFPQKPKLPFLPAKEKIEVTIQEQETLRPVPLSRPAVLGSGYAAEGLLLARLSPPLEGKAGRSIFGSEIPCPKTDLGGIYLSEHLRKLGTEIVAGKAGFFRWGENWLELFPYTRHEYSVQLSEDGRSCLLDFKPGSATVPLPAAETLIQECELLGVGRGTLLEAQQIDSMLRETAAEKRRLHRRSLCQRADAEIRVEITPDKQRALLFLKKGLGEGKPLRLEMISQSIRASRLKGMNTDKLKQDILDFYRGEQMTLEGYPLVEGRQPKRGQDGEFRWLISFLPEAERDKLKDQCRANWGQVQGVSSLAEFPLEGIEELAVVQASGKVAALQPAGVGQPGIDIFGAPLPGLKGKEPKLKLFENLKLVKDEILATDTGLLAKGSAGDTLLLRVHPHQDSRIEVRLAMDRMQAFLTLNPGLGTGKPLEAEEVEKAISDQGVIRGIDRDQVADAILRAKGGETVKDLPFAQGHPPLGGAQAELVFHINLASGSSVSLDERGRADYKTQDKITLVQSGDLIAELPPPAEAKEGHDVTGRALTAAKASPFSIQVGKNVERREEENGRIAFYAKAAGELYYEPGLMDILNLHTIEGDVSLKTGNIRFSGSVRVMGAVQTGFSVLAGGNILVEELVQGALMSTDESITAQKGIKGEGKAILRAKKGISAYFAEQATLLCVGDIRITNSALRCQIKCNGRLTLESERGHLLGGQVRVRHGLEVMDLGSGRGIRTEIFFGQDYLVRDRIELEKREIAKLKEKLAELDQEMKHLEKAVRPDQAALEKLRLEKLYTLRSLEKRTHRIFALQERFEEHFPSEIVVRGTAYPGVVLESHGRRAELKTEKKEKVFLFNPQNGKIEEKPLKG